MDLEGFVGILGMRKWFFCGVEEVLRFWKGSKKFLEDLEGFGLGGGSVDLERFGGFCGFVMCF